MNKKKTVSIILAWVIVFTSIPTISYETQAKTKSPSLSSKKISVKKGKKKTVKLKNATKKVRWKVVNGSKKVKIVKKSGKYNNKIKIVAKKTGSAIIQAKCGKKTYKVRIIITKNKTRVPALPQPTVPDVESTIPISSQDKYATITFDLVGLGDTITKKIKIGEPYGMLPEPMIDSYAFIGWYTGRYSGVQIKETDICTGDATFYAGLYYLGGAIDYEEETNWVE